MTLLISVFRNGAGVNDKNVRGFRKIDLFIAFFLKHPGNGGCLRVIKLAAQGIKSDLFHKRVAKIIKLVLGSRFQVTASLKPGNWNLLN
jgi:hypothetical protein